MRAMLTERIAVYGLLIGFSFIILFHVLALLRIVPYEMLWGGRLQNPDQMVVFESVAILINAIMLGVVCIRARIIQWILKPSVIKIALWIMVVLFALNTLGNLFSKNTLEQLIFTPVTFVLSIFCWRLTIGKKA
ncbi:MAG: hypothetical protein JNM57_13375 [Cyclobacteriaceae bacterium]|nr:hypothetical protein [Cyclobacteriaceae bacterium]